MRTFIAIKLPETIITEIVSFQRQIKKFSQSIKLTPQNNIHLTLRFLGEVSDDILEKVKEVLKGVSSSFNSFEIKVKGAGYFPPCGLLRIIWVGCDDSNLTALIAGTLRKRLENLPIHRDEHKFTPHITIARVKELKDKQEEVWIKDFLENNKEKIFGRFRVNSLEIYKSDLEPSGAEYTILEKFNLRTQNGA